MKRLLLLLFFVGSFARVAQAQSCDEALAYYVTSTPEEPTAQWVAQTACSGESEVLPLLPALVEQGVGEFAWSGVNQSIAYGFGTIYVISADEPSPRSVIEESETVFYHSPVWSPDGMHLVVIAADEENAAETLVLSDLNGETREISLIADNPEEEILLVPLQWSPDGMWIAYALGYLSADGDETTIELLSTACISDPALPCEAHTLAITDNSGEQSTLDDDETMLFEHWWGMAWSPDSQQLAFLCGTEALCFLNVDGTDFRRSDITIEGNSLAWSPSDDYLAYHAAGDIYVYDIAEDTHTNITNTPERNEYVPTWIPLPEGAFLLGDMGS